MALFMLRGCLLGEISGEHQRSFSDFLPTNLLVVLVSHGRLGIANVRCEVAGEVLEIWIALRLIWIPPT